MKSSLQRTKSGIVCGSFSVGMSLCFLSVIIHYISICNAFVVIPITTPRTNPNQRIGKVLTTTTPAAAAARDTQKSRYKRWSRQKKGCCHLFSRPSKEEEEEEESSVEFTKDAWRQPTTTTFLTTSLASSYVLGISSSLSSGNTKNNNILQEEEDIVATWTLIPISNTLSPNDKNDRLRAEGAQAWHALHKKEYTVLPCATNTDSEYDNNNDSIGTTILPSIIILTCQWNQQNNELQVTAVTQNQNGYEEVVVGEGNEESTELLQVLSRVLVQWTISQSSKIMTQAKEKEDSSSSSSSIILQLPNEPEKLHIQNIRSEDGIRDLFRTMFSSKESSTTIEDMELVEMVDKHGQPLGIVPRNLVHTFNLLHRGIGVFVRRTKNPDTSSIICWEESPSSTIGDLYVHRRTDTKRIFPSLYDMFIGGVSCANEDYETTARRELSEELGLEQALVVNQQTGGKNGNDDDKDTDGFGLTDPILDCIVCTAYNRCYVRLFGYTVNEKLETIQWQKEEVAWGDFVPYPIIVAAADRSIERFALQKQWPGVYPPIQSNCQGTILIPQEKSSSDDKDRSSFYASNNSDWKQWDFVPDGLLVWEAWLRYLENKK